MKNVFEIMFRWCLTYDAVYIYINGQCPIIKTCSNVTLNLSSKDYSSVYVRSVPQIPADKYDSAETFTLL